MVLQCTGATLHSLTRHLNQQIEYLLSIDRPSVNKPQLNTLVLFACNEQTISHVLQLKEALLNAISEHEVRCDGGGLHAAPCSSPLLQNGTGLGIRQDQAGDISDSLYIFCF